MSLINQMLKDLEKRSQTSSSSDAALMGLQPAAAKEKRLKSRLLILGLIALTAVWLWNIAHYYLKHHQTVVTIKSPIQSQIIPLHDGAPAPVSPSPALASLTGINLQVQDKITHFRFLLDKEVLYQLSTDPRQNSMVITLKNVRLTTNLPLLDYIDSAVKNITVVPLNQDDLKIILELNPGAILSKFELNKETKLPELQLDIEMKNQKKVNDEAALKNAAPAEQQTGTLKKVVLDMNIDQQYQEALNLAESGQVYSSVHQLAAIVDKHPDYHSARESLVSLLLQQGAQEKASQFLAVGLQLQPYYPPFIELKARMLVDKGKVHEALNLLRKAPPALNANPDYYAFIAALYQRLGELPAAEKLYWQLTTLHPEKGAWWLGLGITLDGLGKNAQALEAYTRADNSPDLSPELRGYVGSRLRA